MIELKKRVLVTGAGGFIGSHLIERIKNDFDVYALVRYTAGRYVLGELSDVKVLFGDLSEGFRVREIVKYVQPDMVVHLGAMSAQSYSVGHPIETLQTNFIGTVNLAESCYKLVDNFELMIAAGCYSEDTKVLTRQGWKNGEQLNTGDLVLSINPKTKEIQWKIVEKIVKKDYVGPMVHFKGKSVDLLVTPNHRMIIEPPSGNKLRVEEARKTAKRSYCWLPNGQWKGITPENIENELFYIAGFYIAEGHSDVKITPYITQSELSHQQYIVNHRDRLGRFKKIKQINHIEKESVSYRVFFTNKDTYLRKKVVKKLKKLGITANIEKRCVFSSSQILYETLDTCGHSAITKRIPRWMLEANINQLKHLYEGLVDGDGSRMHNNDVYYTSSKELAGNFVELCIKLGFNVIIHKRRKKKKCYINKREIKLKYPQFTIYVSKRRRGLHNKNANIVPYSGVIWCPVIRDNHTLLVKRNGRVAFCGNTAEEYGRQSSFPIKESQPLDAHSPYAVSKIASDYYLQYMKNGFGFPVTIMRAFNSYGRVRNRHFLVERVVTQMLEGGDVRLGDPDPVIDWVYVSDHVEAYVKALEQPDRAVGETFNICTGVGTSIRDLALKVSEITGWSGRIIWHTVPKRPVVVSRLVGDPSKIGKMLGWKAEVSLEDGLRRTVDFWKSHLNGDEGLG